MYLHKSSAEVFLFLEGKFLLRMESLSHFMATISAFSENRFDPLKIFVLSEQRDEREERNDF